MAVVAADGEVVVEDDRELEVDVHRFQQVLENLFRNAVEHAGGDVTVYVGALEGGRGIYVEDDGPGVPLEDRGRVFEAGYSTEGGTGIGLSIARTVVEAHGGEIVVTEGRDGGARFEITGIRDPISRP